MDRDHLRTQIPNPKSQWSPVQPQGPQLVPPAAPSTCLCPCSKKAEKGQKWC